VNALEREEDPDGVWRRFTNTALAGPYQGLFGELDRLVLLQPRSWEVVLGWRTEQEHKLRRRLQGAGADPARTMSDPELARFVSHYERLTRHIMAEMPPRADFVLRLDGERRATLTTGGAQAAP
jgi:D-glycerate 3-kinase